ncbi:MAG: hypothetical protein K5920_03815 [Bacteroidales bacterium]|nr:hypothetical protein [Bacteroidales bacterium]
MKREEPKVIIGTDCDIVYSSFYIQGLYQLFGKKNVGFRRIDGKPDQTGNLCFVVYRGEEQRKYVLSYTDSYKVNESLYDWCDVYGSVNANFSKTPKQFHDKLIALCPSFGVRLWSIPQALSFALFDQVGTAFSVKKRIGKVWRMTRRPPYNAYAPSLSSDHYVFFLSTLWYNDEWNKNDEGVNSRRANFIRACKELEEVVFEGGLVSQGKERSSEDLFADCLFNGIPMSEWMDKTKRSALVFNTPAFWDCHGWKLGEYLALGKCIVSTELSNDLPVPLEHGKNIHFIENTPEAMKEAIKYIVDHPDYRVSLEKGARDYWGKYGTPKASLKLLGLEQ